MKIPKNFYNWLSFTGFILALNALILMLILFVISMTTAQSNAYLGIFIYIVLPMFLVLGMLMIPIGMWIKMKKKIKYPESDQRYPVLDLNNKRHKDRLIIISVFTLLFLVVSAMGSYEAFHYSESVEFCGTLCHKVMEPEYVTYLHSPHARVPCVECHVGEGAGWYVKSKLSGLYQVYSVLFNKYPRPIETPIKNLRPARETCEKCHWPQKFYAQKLRNQRGYLTDSLNTEWNISLLMKIGPKYSSLGLKEGIHWHINPGMKIEYKASAENRETIPWVRFTNLKTGEVQIFQDSENMLDQKALDTLATRTMDCMDCHNRPSHSYKSPSEYVDNAMITGEIPKELPFVKLVAMQVLKGPFTEMDSSLRFIADSIRNFYRISYPSIFSAQRPLIEKAIAGIHSEFKKNVFPYMRVTANAYLNHIGHLESDGCFRCHSDRHQNEKGKVISKDCNWCHTIIAQGPTGDVKSSPVNETMEFMHPVNIKDKWKTAFCTECHLDLYP